MQSRYMDPINSARKKFSRMSQVQMDGEPVTKVEIQGDGEPVEAPEAPVEAPEVPEVPMGGFGGGEEPETEAEALGDDDGPLEEGEEGADDDTMERLNRAREQFRAGQQEYGEDPLWNDPYAEPDDDEYDANWEFFNESPEELEANAFTPEEVEKYRAELEAQNIDSYQVYPKFLQSRFGLTTPESYWLEKALNGVQDAGAEE